jgi:hypothetical protein
MEQVSELLNLFESNGAMLRDNPKYCKLILDFIVALIPEAASRGPIVIHIDPSVSLEEIEKMEKMLQKQGFIFSCNGMILSID